MDTKDFNTTLSSWASMMSSPVDTLCCFVQVCAILLIPKANNTKTTTPPTPIHTKTL